jgi:hypothetical protein
MKKLFSIHSGSRLISKPFFPVPYSLFPFFMKYFFLADGWSTGRVWEFGGLWDESTWLRSPQIQRLNLSIEQQQEHLWLYQVEDAVIMIEVKPNTQINQSKPTIGQVLIKRLIAAEQAIEILAGIRDTKFILQ